MARKSPDWAAIKQDYLENHDTIQLKELAEKYGVKPATLRSRKNREDWDAELSGSSGSVSSGVATLKDNPKEKKATQRKKATSKKTSATQRKNATSKKKVATKKDDSESKMDLQILEELEDADLTDMQRFFCLHYIKSFNATQSAIKAGYSPESAHVIGHENLRKPKIRDEIRRLKAGMANELFVSVTDILNQYAKIAFADITDFVEFGTEVVPVMASGKPIVVTDPDTGKKQPLLKEINVVRFKESFLVDGQLISQVKQGKDGSSLQLIDKMRALEKLEQYLDVIPDEWKRKIDEEKLAIDKAKLDLERLKVTGDGAGSDREAINDFIKATTVPVDEVKDLFEDDEDEEN